MMSVSLIPFESCAHLGNTFRWIQDEELRHLFLMRGEVNWEKHQAYFKSVLKDPSQEIYAVMLGQCHVGNCGFKNINLPLKHAELWIYLGEPSVKGKGIGYRATELLLEQGFNILELELIYLHVADYNIVATRMYERLNFVRSSFLINATEWSNRGCKIIRMELSKSSWTSQ